MGPTPRERHPSQLTHKNLGKPGDWHNIQGGRGPTHRENKDFVRPVAWASMVVKDLLAGVPIGNSLYSLHNRVATWTLYFLQSAGSLWFLWDCNRAYLCAVRGVAKSVTWRFHNTQKLRPVSLCSRSHLGTGNWGVTCFDQYPRARKYTSTMRCGFTIRWSVLWSCHTSVIDFRGWLISLVTTLSKTFCALLTSGKHVVWFLSVSYRLQTAQCFVFLTCFTYGLAM